MVTDCMKVSQNHNLREGNVKAVHMTGTLSYDDRSRTRYKSTTDGDVFSKMRLCPHTVKNDVTFKSSNAANSTVAFTAEQECHKPSKLLMLVRARHVLVVIIYQNRHLLDRIF